jgi:hypothetical protein
MWVVKAKGETYYVEHVECSVPWNTKETPDNTHTKGSIKVLNCLVTIDDDNCAKISELTDVDRVRIRNAERGITRVIIKGSYWVSLLKEKIKDYGIKHGPFKHITGACTSSFYITDIFDKEAVLMLQLALTSTDFRVLKPNESYYKVYDDPKFKNIETIYNDDLYEVDDEDDED